ncbi:hypothetical protein [Kitasatospora sp. NPDC047058]|uniref:hypothetical protein n=1 Tax=Kitasatospora sp. NPDC047058 TaxID=3155620 RepID=UPI0033D7C480
MSTHTITTDSITTGVKAAGTTATGATAGTGLNERLLDAGAVLPAGTLPAAGQPDSPADVLTARSYAHPVLDGRRIVRLVPGALGPAEDLAVEFLGLTPDAEPAEVGQVRQEALGFPAWALVHDPANGHHALALVKEMERLARQAKSKPGHAKDGFEELAVRLGRAVPHFLPTYCEEVGRIFLEQGNQTYAATYFGKAREAERTHNLTVDEERLRAVFLEFALAGALTVKSLRQYVKELSGRLDPLTAWQRFRQLCTERSAAGMAPYAGVAEDARALIRAAGLDRTEHERALLAELLASPAVNRAPGAFWKSWHGAVVDLGRSDAAVRARLLEILPDPAGVSDQNAQDASWLAVLAESGAEQLLTGPAAADAQAAETPAGDAPAVKTPAAETPAAWLERWLGHLGRGWRSHGISTETVALVTRMAGRLRADGVPVDVFTGRRNSTTRIEVLDLLLAEGVPVADPADGLTLGLTDWVRDALPDSRPLAALAADPRFRPALRAAVPGVWDAAVAKQVPALPVLRELFVEWSDERADELLAARGLASATDLLRVLRTSRPAIVAENPAAAERIAGLDVTGLLARTLRNGIFDELGWPALEEALARLGVEPGEAPGGPAGRTLPDNLFTEEAWPHLVLARGSQVLVVGPQGIVLEHTLRIPDKLESWQRPRLRYVDGELLVAWYREGKQHAYWSGRPAETFELGGETIVRYYGGSDEPGAPSLPLPGGGRTTGERPLHAGDTRAPAEHAVIGDGTGHWTVRWGQDGDHLVELDPATGTLGRSAEPPRLSAGAAAGRLDVRRTRLLPMQPGLEDTPLGTDGVVLGSWVRVDGGRVTTGTADGTTLVLPGSGGHARCFPVGRLTLPGGAHPLVVEERGGGLTLALPVDTAAAAAPAAGADRTDPERGADTTAGLRVCRPGGLDAAGTAYVPPLAHWHALRPRDEEGSRTLRAVTDEQAARLIDAAWPVDTEPAAVGEQRWLTVQGRRRLLANGKKSRSRVPVAAVGEAMPGLGHPLLRAGVAGLARAATDLLDRVARFVPQPEAGRSKNGATPADGYRPAHGRDHELRAAAGVLLPGADGFGRTWESGEHWRVLNNLRTVTAVLADPPAVPADADGWATPLKVELSGSGDDHHGWLHLLGRLGTLAYAAAAPLTGSAERAGLVLLLDELTKGPLADRGATLREVTLTEPLNDATHKHKHPKRTGQVLRHGDRTVIVLGCRHHRDDRVHWLAVDHDPSGAFGPVAHFGTAAERTTEDRIGADWAARFGQQLALHGAPARDAAHAAAFAARTGIGTTRATLLLSPANTLFQWWGAVLPADRLKEYGLKSTEAKAARDWLRDREHTALAEVWSALLPAEPEDLWTTGPDTEAGAARWTERFGTLVTLPEEAQATVTGVAVSQIEAVLNPARTAWLSRTTGYRLRADQHGGPLRLHAEDPAALPGNNDLGGAVDALRWLAYHLPADSPLRPLLPQAATALRTRLGDPGLLLDYNLNRTVKDQKLTPVLRTRYGLPAEGGADADGLVRCGEALVLAPGHGGEEEAWLRPAGLTGADDPLLELLDGLSDSYWFGSQRPALEAVLSGGLDRLVAPPAHTADAVPAPAAWAQNPQRSVPGLVAEVAAAHGLGEDAAALYLQLLALPDPTDRNVARWTGWKPARLKRARAELAATALVLEAKRARAGRSLFLPGGWQEAKAPGLPAETWKAGLYELPTHRAVLPHLSVPELFARAWQRIGDGDTPGYEELQTGKRRKARR